MGVASQCYSDIASSELVTDCDLRTLVPRPPPFSIARRTRIRDWYLSSHAWRQGGKQLRYQVTYHTYLSYTPSIERVVDWTVCFCILKVVITIHYVVFVKLFANCIRLCSTVVWNCFYIVFMFVCVGGRERMGSGRRGCVNGARDCCRKCWCGRFTSCLQTATVPVRIPPYRIYTPLPTPPNKAWWSPEGNNGWGHLQWCNASDSHCPRSTHSRWQ